MRAYCLTIVSMERDLLHALEDYRKRQRLSVRALSKRLHVSDSYLLLVRNGARKVNVSLLQGIYSAAPELRPAVHALLENGHDHD